MSVVVASGSFLMRLLGAGVGHSSQSIADLCVLRQARQTCLLVFVRMEKERKKEFHVPASLRTKAFK